MRKLLVANWKENPASEKKALELFRGIARVAQTATAARRSGADVVVCPPSIYLEEIAATFRKMPAHARKNLFLGAQDIFWEEQGAFTGEIGSKMLRALGVRYVIIGHSERRRFAGETDAMINRKIKSALKNGLRPILCVGEPASVRRKGVAASRAYVKNQLKKDLAGIFAPHIENSALAVAYEPIWAIGTGRNDKPEDAFEMARFLKSFISSSPVSSSRASLFLYGGSVNSKNVADYVQYKEVDGALVGGASLKAAEFAKMIEKIKNF